MRTVNGRGGTGRQRPLAWARNRPIRVQHGRALPGEREPTEGRQPSPVLIFLLAGSCKTIQQKLLRSEQVSLTPSSLPVLRKMFPSRSRFHLMHRREQQTYGTSMAACVRLRSMSTGDRHEPVTATKTAQCCRSTPKHGAFYGRRPLDALLVQSFLGG
jgi:hypothetical protein